LKQIFKAFALAASLSLLLDFVGCGSNTAQTSQQSATPSITQVSPQTIPAGSQSMTLRVTGTNFPSQAAILWNGTPLATTPVDANTLTSTIGSSSLANPGTAQLQVQNVNTMQESQSVPVTIVVPNSGSPSPLTISISPLPQGVVGVPYTGALAASGGTAPYTWNLVTGKLPAGLTLASSTGIISGAPTTAGNFSFSVAVSDSSSAAQSATTTVTLSVAATPGTPSPLTISSSSLPAGTQSSTYASTLQAAGGTAPYTWSISSGNLPSGLSLASNGVVSGSPKASGNFSFGVTVKDAGSPAQTASATITLSIVASGTPLAISSTALPAGTQNQGYSTALNATGGTAPYAWSILSGALPAGIGLVSNTGVISGTPSVSGTASLTIQVTDASSPVQSATVKLSLTVSPLPLVLTTSSLPSGTKGASYSSSLQATGGQTPYIWSITGSLPAGLILSPTTGQISGTPTATGSANFTATVTDSGSPTQTKSVSLSIAVVVPAPPALTLSAAFPTATPGTAFSSSMSAAGGTPAYTWSITAGTLPPGLTLAATTGIISGIPSASGTYNFTATVTDNSSPALKTSVPTSIFVSGPPLTPTGPGTTWFIRPDGGTRYSANQTAGQCDGQADVAYSGSGTNQHCAFNDYRYLYDDGSWQNSAWVIAGGDTVIIRGGAWRVGVNQGVNPSDVWCAGTGNPYNCTNPTIPSGTATQPTRILGENYGSCTQSNMTQLFGGFGVFATLNLSGAQYVTVQCIELTRHSQCIRYGNPIYPSSCNSSYPIDDFATNGIVTNTGTHDVTLQDMWIHGFISRGIIGPIGGTVNATRVDIAYNGGAGWDFDDGNATPNVNGAINLSQVTVEWNGCNQAYPGTGAISCYSQSTGGYGDGIGTPAGTCLSANVDHSTFRYNTQDGYDMLHNDTGSCSMTITNSTSYGNNGSQFKWGPNDSPLVFENNTAVANCTRLSAPFPGQPATYNANLSDFCRASDAIAMGFRDGGSLTMTNNTIVTYAPTTFDISCWGTYPDPQGVGTCNNSTFLFENNIVVGYDNPSTYNLGGQAGGPGNFYFSAPIGTFTRNNNLYFGMRATNFPCPTGVPSEMCADPLFVNEPTGRAGNFVESELDNFNFSITPGSPAVGAGIYIPSLTLDYSGATRPNPPSLGALEP
jgi:hypothetical protein